MPNDIHMDPYIIYFHLFKCVDNLGPRAVNMLQVPPHLHPTLHWSISWFWTHGKFIRSY